MLFSEYVRILQNHYIKSIGDAELCRILFDFVIIPADLRNSKDPTSNIIISPGTISKILAGNAPLHTQIRDHIYDDSVINKLVKNFNDEIVPELNPEKEDLCFQMMEIIKSDNISSEHKTEFKMLAQPETIASFLAKVFVYVVSTNGSNGKQSNEKNVMQENSSLGKSSLSIKGITKNMRLSETAIEELFLSRTEISCEILLEKIKLLFSEVAAIHLKKKSLNSKSLEIKSIISKPFSIETELKNLLDSFANKFEIELPEDFYDFGDLYIIPFGGVDSLGLPTSSICGSSEAEKKYMLVNRIEDYIKTYLNVLPYFEAFKNTKCLSLALSNSGTNYDQDVRITLYFDQDVLLLPEEIAYFDEDALRYLVDDCDYESQFKISKGIDYLNYEESENIKPHPISPRKNDLPFFSQTNDINYEEEIKNLLGYFYAEDNSKHIVEITVDNINQFTAVAFPTVILIKNTVKEIPYKIKSKQQSQIISGTISVQSLTSND